MLLSALFFLGGIVLVQQWSTLPSALPFALAVLLFAGLFFLLRRRAPFFVSATLKYSALFVAGAGWAIVFAQQALQHRLPESLASKTMLVEGRVVGIPVIGKRVTRFYLAVEGVETAAPLTALAVPPRKIRLSWYSNKKRPAQQINAGERWQFVVRLKPPHGFFNPGGFDYEGWLFQQGVDAVGYVRKPQPEKNWRNRRLSAPSPYTVDYYRQQLSDDIRRWLSPAEAGGASEHGLSAMTGLVTALAVGDRAAIAPEQWQDMLHTGTNHLMAISGLHIGLAYLLGYLFGRRVLAYLVPAAWLSRIPAQHIGIVCGVALALLYALLAGLSIPTQRALIMLSGFAIAALLRRNYRALDALGLALLLVLLWDPLSVLSPGFWFSFIAVAVIFYTLAGRASTQPDTRLLRFTGKLGLWVRLQLMITLALLPLSLYLFQQSSLVAPLANLVLVPYVSFLVVPVILLGLLLSPFVASASALCMMLAATLLQWVWPFIHALANLPFAYRVDGALSRWQLLAAALAMVALLLPRRVLETRLAGLVGENVTARYLPAIRLLVAGLLFLPVFLWPRSPALPEAAFKLTVLDVGQGLASVVQTRHHTLVFDSGARFGDRLDAGSSVVVPYLRANGIRQLDMLVISHGDADHIGGAASVLKAYPQTPVVGQDIEALAAAEKSPCVAGMGWQWDDVHFRFLHPSEQAGNVAEGRKRRRNNHSCVLLVASSAGRALLSGDIEKKVENQLLQQSLLPAVDVLVAPHHGSRTSSSAGFLDALQPELAIFAAGYRNRYRLPGEKVVARYRQRGVELFETGRAGAVSVSFIPGRGRMPAQAWRRTHRRYWNHVL